MAATADPAERALASEYLQRYPGEAANMAETWPMTDLVELFAQAPLDDLVPVFEQLAADSATPLLDALEVDRAAHLVARIDPGRTAPLLARLRPARRDDVLARVPSATAGEIRQLMTYPPDSAGSLMDVHVTTVRPDAQAGSILERVRQAAHARGTDVIVVEDDGSLAGTLPIEDVALAATHTPARELVRRAPARIQALASREDVVDQLSRLKLASLPVVDADDRVLGVIRYSALVRAAEEEASLDMQKMVGVSAEERALSPVSFAVRKRLPWLEINLATAFLAAAVVGAFENIIAQFTALAVLLPVVAGQSGNTGAQALAVTMRGLALREIRLRHWRRVLVKEGMVAFINSLGVSLTTSVAVYIWSRSWGLAGVIGLSMVMSMVCAGLAGAAVPMGLVAVRQDPAQSSSIVLTTVTDVVGFFSFLGIATLLASHL
jgi:magnesium transporter